MSRRAHLRNRQHDMNTRFLRLLHDTDRKRSSSYRCKSKNWPSAEMLYWTTVRSSCMHTHTQTHSHTLYCTQFTLIIKWKNPLWWRCPFGSLLKTPPHLWHLNTPEHLKGCELPNDWNFTTLITQFLNQIKILPIFLQILLQTFSATCGSLVYPSSKETNV